MMRLLTVGDSFTYGEELDDLNQSWPCLLSNDLGFSLTNLAQPGSGNSRMVRCAVEQVNNYDIIIIAWSHFARIEVADEVGPYDLWPGCSPAFHRQFGEWRKEIIEYFTRYHNDQYLYGQYLLNIVLLQNYLRQQGKAYVMLDAFGNTNGDIRETHKNQLIFDQIDPTYYLGWPDQSMMEWTHRLPQGPRGHFLEQGHALVADKLKNFIQTKILKN